MFRRKTVLNFTHQCLIFYGRGLESPLRGGTGRFTKDYEGSRKRRDRIEMCGDGSEWAIKKEQEISKKGSRKELYEEIELARGK